MGPSFDSAPNTGSPVFFRRWSEILDIECDQRMYILGMYDLGMYVGNLSDIVELCKLDS